MNQLEALATYHRYSRIWHGRSEEQISVSAALHELGQWEARLPPGKLQKRISDLIDQIITDNHSPEEVEELCNE